VAAARMKKSRELKGRSGIFASFVARQKKRKNFARITNPRHHNLQDKFLIDLAMQ
jgi:DNA-binding cell septation regulator SpoVG